MAKVLTVASVILLATGCGDDKKTFGGGFESLEECVEGYRTLDPSMSEAERVATCSGDENQ